MTEGPQDEQGSNVWQRLFAYAAGAWGFLQGLQYVSEAFAWPTKIQQVAILVKLPP